MGDALKALSELHKRQNHCLPEQLCGSNFSGVRQDLMRLLGHDLPKSKCGVTALAEAFYKAAPITTWTCRAHREKQFQAWAYQQLGLDQKNVSSYY